jgi:hypothetical protein
MPKTSSYRFVEQCVQNGLAWTVLHGYQWFRREFRRAVAALERAPRTRQNRALLIETYTLLGDLYFVINAPCAYVRSYIRAVRLYPRRRSLLREAAEVVSMMEPSRQSGRCESLIRRVEREISAPASVLGELTRPGRFAYTSRDPVWLACERLARCQARGALDLVKKERGMRGRQVRMMAWGAMDKAHVVMQEWSSIARGRGKIDLGTGDWFFLPGTLWESPEFWETLLSVLPRIRDLCLDSPTSEIQGPPELLDRALPIRWTQVHRCAIEFHLARTGNDKVALGRMCQKFPRWSDPRVAMQWLRRTGSPPTRGVLLAAFSQRGVSSDQI